MQSKRKYQPMLTDFYKSLEMDNDDNENDEPNIVTQKSSQDISVVDSIVIEKEDAEISNNRQPIGTSLQQKVQANNDSSFHTLSKGTLEAMLREILSGQEDIKQYISEVEEQVRVQRKEQADVLKELQNLKDSHDDMMQRICVLENKTNMIERKSRERNLRLIGIPEQYNDDCYAILYDIMRMMDINPRIESAHRTGKRHAN